MGCGHLFPNPPGRGGPVLTTYVGGIGMVYTAALAGAVTNRSVPCRGDALSDPSLTSKDKTETFVRSHRESTSTSQTAPLSFALTMFILITQPEGAFPKIIRALRIGTWGRALPVPSHRRPRARCRLVHEGTSTRSQPPGPHPSPCTMQM